MVRGLYLALLEVAFVESLFVLGVRGFTYNFFDIFFGRNVMSFLCIVFVF